MLRDSGSLSLLPPPAMKTFLTGTSRNWTYKTNTGTIQTDIMLVSVDTVGSVNLSEM